MTRGQVASVTFAIDYLTRRAKHWHDGIIKKLSLDRARGDARGFFVVIDIGSEPARVRERSSYDRVAQSNAKTESAQILSLWNGFQNSKASRVEIGKSLRSWSRLRAALAARQGWLSSASRNAALPGAENYF